MTSWHCLTCPAHGTGPDADKTADKHTRDTGHATSTRSTP